MDNNKIVESFQKVKEDIIFLKNELKKVKNDLFFKDNEVLNLKSEIEDLKIRYNNLKQKDNEFQKNALILELNKVKEDLLLKNKEINSLKLEINTINERLNTKINSIQSISIGNDRVNNHHQQSSTIINNHQQWQTMNEDKQNLSTINNKSVENIKNQTKKSILNYQKPLQVLLENKFRSLTDREFSVFMAIYQLEEEKGKVGYLEIANMLEINETTVRNYITSLINKQIPIDKERIFNKKALFRIKKEFRELNLASNLLELRQQIQKNTVNKT